MSIGQIVGGRYELLGLLGAGGMGEVYRSRDRLSNEIVALKRVRNIVRPGTGSSSSSSVTVPAAKTETYISPAPLSAESPTEAAEVAKLSLAAEFRVLASLRHPNIISVLDYGFEDNGKPYLVMSLLSSAETIAKAGKQRSERDRLTLIAQLLQALSYLHRHGVVHRDLKPSNVLVTEDRVTVLDFGIAGLPASYISGTIGYMAPEVMHGAKATTASDFFAVGVIAYELLTGRRPFRTEADLQQPADLSPFSEDVKLRQFMSRLLALRPDERYTEASMALSDLAAIGGDDLAFETAEYRESYLKAAPFIGRERELAELTTALLRAGEGRGGGWLVAGESGVGKSRLLAEIRTRALVQGTLVLTGRIAEDDRAPYSLFRNPVIRLLLILPVNDEQAALLKIIVPEITSVLGRPVPDPPPLDPQVLTETLALAVEDLFARHKAPILLELEDLHFVGESLSVVLRLVERARASRLLILGAYRDDERPSLRDECKEMSFLRLDRLSRDGIRKLSISILGKRLGADEAIVNFLERETEGNSFFLVEAVRALAEERGRLDLVSGRMLPEHVFAGGMRDAVRRRLAKVPSSLQLCLGLAAVLGRDVEVEMLRAGSPETDLDQLLAVCANSAILEGHGYAWRFTHDKLREGVLADLPPETGRELHTRAAMAIEHVHGNAIQWIHRLGHHWKEAGNTEKAAHYLLLATGQLLSAGTPESAVLSGSEALRQMGVDIPKGTDQLRHAISQEMKEIARLFASRDPSVILELPPLSDPAVKRILSVLRLMTPAAHICQQYELFALCNLKCTSLCLKYGVGPYAPEIFSTYAAVVRGITGDTRLAFELSTTALALDQRLNGRATSPVLFIHAWFTNHWVEPTATNVAFARNGADRGFEDGDLLYACFNAAAVPIYLMAAAAKLPEVALAADEQLSRIADRVRVSVFHCLLERQTAYALEGFTRTPLSLSDSALDEDRDLAYICETSNFNQIGYYCATKARLHYLYGDSGGALDWIERGSKVISSFRGQVVEWEFTFTRALVSLAALEDASDREREKLTTDAHAALQQLTAWSLVSEANFAHRRDLVLAELLASLGRDAEAAKAFDDSASLATRAKAVSVAALAHERAAFFHFSRGNRERAQHHANQAISAWEEWGAFAKASWTLERFASMFGDKLAAKEAI